jgi:tetratricopeptide (TPR) repeat protein
MAEKPEFDVAAAHKYFSAHCFNAAWDLIDKTDRTAEEDEAMVHLSLASLWHWTQREDCTATSLSAGYWQVSRTYALAGEADSARRYGQRCLEVSQSEDVGPFYVGYAYEALARAESTAGDWDRMKEYLEQARRAAQEVGEADNRKILLDDLATIA